MAEYIRSDFAKNISVVLTESSFVTVLSSNPNRIHCCLSNRGGSGQRAVINLSSVASATSSGGIVVSGGTVWRMPESKIYTGEISAISLSDEIELFVIEY